MPGDVIINAGEETPPETVTETAVAEVAAVSEAISEAANTQIAGALALTAIAEPSDELVGLVRDLNAKVDAMNSRIDSLTVTTVTAVAEVVAVVEEAAEESAEETETEIEQIPEQVAESTEDAISEIPAIQERQKRRSFWM